MAFLCTGCVKVLQHPVQRQVYTSSYYAYIGAIQWRRPPQGDRWRPNVCYVGRKYTGLPPMAPREETFSEGWAKNEVVTEILSGLHSIEAALQGSSGVHLKPKHVSSFLVKIGELCSDRGRTTTPEEIKMLTSDVRFQRLGEILHGKALELKPHTLITSTSCLLKLTSEDSFILQSLQQQLLWMLSRISYSQVLRVLNLYKDHQETDLRKKIYEEALSISERRWVEINHPADLVTLFYMVEKSPNKIELLSKLEDRTLDVCNRMTPKEVYRVFYVLAKHQRRNKPLLRALVYHLGKNLDYLNNIQLTNLCYSCSALNFFDDVLLVEISQLLAMRLDNFEPDLLSSILQSFSSLKWLKTDLLDGMAESLLATPNPPTSHLVGLVLSCARLAYLPAVLSNSLAMIMPQLSTTSDCKEWLDIAWSLAVLQKLDSSTAGSVLSKEFLTKIEASGDLSPPAQLKLTNIAALADNMAEYSGPRLPVETLESFTYKVPLKDDHPAHEVIKVLGSMVPVDKYLRQFVTTPNGYMIDIEMLINRSGEPQPIQDTPYAWDKSSSLPTGVFRVALKVFDYHDFTRYKAQPIGVHFLGCHLLKSLGYYVVPISFADFNQQPSTVGKLKYFQNAVSAVINGSNSLRTDFKLPDKSADTTQGVHEATSCVEKSRNSRGASARPELAKKINTRNESQSRLPRPEQTDSTPHQNERKLLKDLGDIFSDKGEKEEKWS